MNVIYEDKYLIICSKSNDELCEYSDTKPSLARRLGELYGYCAPVYRLDMNVGGIMLYAKDKSTASKLSHMVLQKQIKKEYLAIVRGAPEDAEGEFCDLLFKDSAKNKSYVVKRMRKGVREARLGYTVLKTISKDNEVLSMVRVRLQTGRSHQIRVQFSSRRMPLVGDGKYGGSDNKCSIALWCSALIFNHPLTNKEISVSQNPDTTMYPWNLFLDK